jgi:hypothetical protein
MTLCVAPQRVFVLLSTQSGNFWIHRPIKRRWQYPNTYLLTGNYNVRAVVYLRLVAQRLTKGIKYFRFAVLYSFRKRPNESPVLLLTFLIIIFYFLYCCKGCKPAVQLVGDTYSFFASSY